MAINPELEPPAGFKGWVGEEQSHGAILWRPPRPQMPPRHAFIAFPHHRRFQVTMIVWAAFVVLCFVLAWATRGN